VEIGLDGLDWRLDWIGGSVGRAEYGSGDWIELDWILDWIGSSADCGAVPWRASMAVCHQFQGISSVGFEAVRQQLSRPFVGRFQGGLLVDFGVFRWRISR